VAANEFLEHEVILLLAKHGERPVLAALAGKIGMSADELRDKLAELRKMKPRASTRKPIHGANDFEAVIAQHPNKAEDLKVLFGRFQNKTFLPELKDVRRFLDRHSQKIGRIKSRADAAPKLAKLLGSLDSSELAGLCHDSEQGEYSSLGIISDEIMRRNR
jgi:hypothetical protein